MWLTTLRNLLSHKLRLALSGLAIVLGVAFVSGTMIFTDTLSKTFGDLIEGTASDVSITPASAFDSGLAGTSYNSSASFVPAELVGTVAAVDGVAAAEGYVQAEGVYVLDADGEVLTSGGAPGLGVSWNEEDALSASTLTEGRAPERAGEIALDTGAIEETGYRIGDIVEVLTPGPRVEAELVGVFEFGESGGLAGATLTAFDAATAQELLAEPGQFHGITVAAADGVSDEQLQQRIAAAVGPDWDVQTRAEQANSQSEALAEGLGYIETFLLVFAGVALFVGTFIILNTFSMLVAQRTRELALMRALGASRRQVTRSVLGEALVLGVAGSTLGLVTGFGIAAGLRALFGVIGLTLDGELVFSAGTVAWSYAVGIVVTLVAAYVPARRAAKTAPVAAMRDDHVAVEKSLRARTVAGTVLSGIGLLALVAGNTSDDGSSAASYVGLGAIALVLGAVALSPVLARPFLRVVGAVLPRVWGTTGLLARENAVRSPRRTAATASALMVGLALVSAFSILGASTNKSVDALIDGSIRSEFVVSTAVAQPFTTEVADELRAVDGVATVMQERFGQGEFAGEQSMFVALDAETLDASIELDYLSGSAAGLRGNGVLVDETTATDRGWEVGESVQMRLANGAERELVVGGVFAPNEVLAPMLVSLETYDATGGLPLDRYVYVGLADGVSVDSVRPDLDAAVAAYPVVDLKDQGEFKAEQKAQVEQQLMLINALLVLSVIIAVLGIVNTLALSVIERTREIGLLRAVGMTRAQLRRMVRLESVVIAMYGATLGLVLGSVLGVSLSRALASQGIEELAVPGGRLVLFLGIAAVIGVLAAVWPARRAARLKVLDAIATS